MKVAIAAAIAGSLLAVSIFPDLMSVKCRPLSATAVQEPAQR